MGAMKSWYRGLFGVAFVAGSVVSAAFAGGQPGGGDRRGPDPHSSVELVSEVDAAVPGETVMIGLLFEIDRGWHIYLDSQNDTGLPPTVTWSSAVDGDAGEGVSFGSIVWPAGKRFTQPGEILDHGYEDSVLLMVPVMVPEGVSVGSELELSGSLEWLACDAAQCVPGFADVSLTLPIRDRAARTGAAARFDAARRGLGTAVTGAAGEDVVVSWDGSTMVVTTRHRATLTFVPGPGCAEVRDLLHAGVSGEDRELRLRFEDDGEGARVNGWVRIQAMPGGTLDSESDLWHVRMRFSGDSENLGDSG